TMENFEGINFIEEKQLIKEYTDMFKEMGIDVNKYSDVIKEMAEANQVLVTSMDDVRQSMIENIVSGEGSFVSSMGSYFKKIFNNMASVIYDVTFSEIDQYFNDAFKTISEKLVEIKKQGGDMVGSMTGLLNSMDLSKLLEADKMNIEFDKVIDSFREKLENMGLSTDLINSLLPPTALSEKIDSLRNMLSGAMKSALDIMDFDTFNKSLGQSLYENVKSGLIQAFTETELYKGLMNKFMPDIEDMFSGAGSFEDAFDIMKDYLDKFEKELEAGGMGFVNNATTETEEDKTLGNSFYNDTNKISIVIEQNFNGSFVGDYDFRRLARDGAVDALKEIDEEVKLVGGF
ncbi:MAG: phage tail tape measure protein, partial [Cetobacterium sp.]